MVPALKRDPFETQKEFFERLPKRPYYVGKIELLADSYDIGTGEFPVQFANVQEWTQNLLKPFDNAHLLLPREQARALYQKGRAWPLYAWLEVVGKQIEIKVLKTITSQGEYLLEAGVRTHAEVSGYSEQYVVYRKGIVTDNRTGLEWVAGPDKDTTWHHAMSWVKRLNLDGGGWRMPTMDELAILYKKGTGERNLTPLLKTTGWYVWSGKTKGPWDAWRWTFDNGQRRWALYSDSRYSRGFAVRFRKDG